MAQVIKEYGSVEFGRVLQAHLDQRGWSRHHAARVHLHCDPSFLQRICAGSRMPSSGFVEGLARMLDLEDFELNHFYALAGCTPPAVAAGWPAVYQSVADVMDDPHLSAEDKVEFAALVQTIASRYRPESLRRVR